jgi:post-segregation antitoxin (ccd killing protein)
MWSVEYANIASILIPIEVYSGNKINSEHMKKLVNISETLRKALEEEVRKKEIEWAIAKMEEISKKAKLEKEAKNLIREFRDK